MFESGMEITITEPIEQSFTSNCPRATATPAKSPDRLPRWMEEEEFEGDPPGLVEKLEAARQGAFHPHEPARYDALVASLHETGR